MIALSTPDESLLLARLVAGEEEPFVAMRGQLARARIAARSESERGILIEFDVPDDAPGISPPRLDLSDVEFSLVGTDGRGFATLWVDGGVVTHLEIASQRGEWPFGARIADVTWTRLIEPEADDEEARFEPVPERDFEQVRRAIAACGAPAFAPEATEAARDHPALEELAARPQGTIALPLLTPLRPILDAAHPPDDEGGGSLLDALPGLIDPSVAAEWLGVPDIDLPVQSLIRRWKAWTEREQPAPVIAAIAAVLLASRHEDGLLDQAARPLARELFHYVRRAGILTWEDAQAHAVAWWREPGAESGVWALAVRSLASRVAEAGFDDPPHTADPRPAAPAVHGDAAPEGAHHAREVSKLRDDLQRARAESQRLREDAAHLRLESEQLRVARTQLRARVRELEAESGPLRTERDRLDRYAHALKTLLAEKKAAADAGHPDPIPDPPEDGWPSDLLAGLLIVLCTGQDRAGARTAMADELRQAGAEVVVHEANGKMPDRFPAEALVVCDVRFIGHAAADRVRAAAARSGTRVLEVRAGQGGIVRAVAVGSGRAA